MLDGFGNFFDIDDGDHLYSPTYVRFVIPEFDTSIRPFGWDECYNFFLSISHPEIDRN